MSSNEAREQAAAFNEVYQNIKAEVGRMMVGQEDVIEGVLTALLAGGHVLLEGVPGLGKTMLVRSLGEAVDLKFSRIQFTPDMMPADIQGTSVLVESDGGGQQVQFREGPLVANLVLADEINRATPKTQSALLEAMQEKQITVGNRSILTHGSRRRMRWGRWCEVKRELGRQLRLAERDRQSFPAR